MDVVSSGPAMFARLFTVLPLEEIVYHGIVLGTSSTRHTLGDTHIHIILKLLATVTSRVYLSNNWRHAGIKLTKQECRKKTYI